VGSPGRGGRRAVRVGLLVLAAAVAAGGAYVLAAVPPTDASWYPRCQLHALTGLHCPGCRTTRALHSLLNGRPVEALRQNAFFPVIPAVILWSFVHSVRVSRGLAEPVTDRRVVRGLTALVVLLLVYAVLRNLPYHPFTLLAPHEL
jgi:hypothetical protein